MGEKDNKSSLFSSIQRFFTLLVCGDVKTTKTSTKDTATSGPKASIVAASKHFSSAHKVKWFVFDSHACVVDFTLFQPLFVALAAFCTSCARSLNEIMLFQRKKSRFCTSCATLI
ncbi:hypothetical protein MTR_1g022080 [Medicago truncatula]|uniref:Uncharacterized protein n=1 Tax=Medicago truncatula TaxID=3880 RepID=A0A072VDK8_MEDTR|nr:hypothetical protein MTR_1g022080 [Medicago truncatula]